MSLGLSTGSGAQEARELLSWLKAQKRAVRRSRTAASWPLLLAGALSLIASLLYLPGSSFSTSALSSGAFLVASPLRHPGAVAGFWLAAVPLW